MPVQWAVCDFSKAAVNRAGAELAAPSEDYLNVIHAHRVLNSWRASHAFALNSNQVHLRNIVHAARCCDPIIAQRLKRTPSIVHKLRRFPDMQLARMQDIGGCRAVLESVAEVKAVHSRFRTSRTKRILAGERNYINCPKESGYRGIHLVYKYGSSASSPHDGKMIEIQIRSRLQHVWATGVETVGAITNSPLKSSIGLPGWLRFFALMGSVFADREGCPLVPGTGTSVSECVDELRELSIQLDAVNRITMFSSTVQTLTSAVSGDIYLLHLKPATSETFIWAYSKTERLKAAEHYLEVENDARLSEGEDVVLVSADSMAALKSAYPNYFLDTHRLTEEVQGILQG